MRKSIIALADPLADFFNTLAHHFTQHAEKGFGIFALNLYFSPAEYKELAKKLLFLTQGDKHAPVTQYNVLQTVQEFKEIQGESENVWFWSPSQLPLLNALDAPFMILPSYFSTGKTKILMKRAENLAALKKKVAYIVCLPHWIESEAKMALTLLMEKHFEHRNVAVFQIIVS